jgi:hypothetical protein
MKKRKYKVKVGKVLKKRRTWKINPRTRLHGETKYKRSEERKELLKELEKEEN